MKKLLLGTVGFAALIAGPAMAADLSVRPVYKIPVAVWSWTGLYVGLNTGGSIGSGSTTNTGVGVFPGGGGVNRLPNLTPDRRPILTPLSDESGQ
jgi:opacity protein-like surface antigen